MTERIISASGAPYDGHDRRTMLDSVARLGFTHIEPAFIVGYTEPFDETAFVPAEARDWALAIRDAGLRCHAMSSHIDLGLPGAADVFARRMDFAAGIGAGVILTNAGAREREAEILRTIEALLPRAQDLHLVIAIENPGDGSLGLVNTAADGIALVDRFRSPFLRLNYDAANTASHRPDFGDFAGDAIRALPVSAYAHIKDVRRTNDGWVFTPLGEGDIGCGRILSHLTSRPEMAIGIEIPMRLRRDPSARPVRQDRPVDLGEIENWLSRSLRFVRGALAGDR